MMESCPDIREMMMKLMMCFAAAVMLSGCSGIREAGLRMAAEERASVTSGRVGCPANQITIADQEKLTWTATCKGKVFYCHAGDGIACTEAMP